MLCGAMVVECIKFHPGTVMGGIMCCVSEDGEALQLHSVLFYFTIIYSTPLFSTSLNSALLYSTLPYLALDRPNESLRARTGLLKLY